MIYNLMLEDVRHGGNLKKFNYKNTTPKKLGVYRQSTPRVGRKYFGYINVVDTYTHTHIAI